MKNLVFKRLTRFLHVFIGLQQDFWYQKSPRNYLKQKSPTHVRKSFPETSPKTSSEPLKIILNITKNEMCEGGVVVTKNLQKLLVWSYLTGCRKICGLLLAEILNRLSLLCLGLGFVVGSRRIASNTLNIAPLRFPQRDFSRTLNDCGAGFTCFVLSFD